METGINELIGSNTVFYMLESFASIDEIELEMKIVQNVNYGIQVKQVRAVNTAKLTNSNKILNENKQTQLEYIFNAAKLTKVQRPLVESNFIELRSLYKTNRKEFSKVFRGIKGLGRKTKATIISTFEKEMNKD